MVRVDVMGFALRVFLVVAVSATLALLQHWAAPPADDAPLPWAPRRSPYAGPDRFREAWPNGPVPAGGGAGRPTVVFGISTMAKNHDERVRTVLSTWGRHADVRVVLSDATDAALDPRNELLTVYGERLERRQVRGIARDASALVRLAGKTFRVWKELCRHDAAFYAVVDDDSFVVMPNVLRVLPDAVAGDPDNVELYTGYVLDHIPGAALVGGGARSAMPRIGTVGGTSVSCTQTCELYSS